MDSTFVIKLVLSVLVGGVWVTLVTMAADRFGSKVGGLAAGLPSTVVVTLLFVGLSQGRLAASEATDVVPLAYAVNGLFLIVYVRLLGKGLPIALGASLTLWFLLSGAIVLADLRDFTVSIAAWLISLVAAVTILEKCFDIPSQGKLSIRYSKRQLVARAAFSGLMIGFGVFMSRIGGPIYGGIFACFPAAFLSSLVITFFSGGAAFSRSVAKAMMLSGYINVVGYGIAVRYLYRHFDLLVGTLGGLFFSLLTGYLTLLFMRRKLS
ncbi:MAG: hypothetical protein GY856_54650 [bacterium]|nr:hypothetical protein [bacterium]